jgi:RNA-binding protein YlmH
MDDPNLHLKIVEERFDRYLSSYAPDHGDFLTPEEQSALMPFFRRNRSQGAWLYGGYPEAERRLPLFMPDYLGIEREEDIYGYFRGNPGECPLAVLQVKVPRQERVSLTHRDYLGALMGCGIKREKIGDIIVSGAGGDSAGGGGSNGAGGQAGAQIVILRELAEYLRDELTSVGRATVIVDILDINEFDPGEVRREEHSYTVSSSRLDNVVSAVFGLSRKLAAEAIAKGLVFVDGTEIQKPDYRVTEGQKLVLRHKGKAIFVGETGTSKKGKVYIKVEKYV